MRFISKLNLYRFVSGWFKSSRGAMIVLLLVAIIARDCLAAMPEFAQGIANVSVAVGRDATFTCHVRHLGGYRVGWLKADTKAIQAIHENVITHNSRVSVSHLDANTWNLHIKAVSEEDRGGYMCQLNTDPMKSQIGFLDVVIPPDFVSEDTSSDVIVGEGSSVKLTCRARGYPEPIVTWRREDGNEIVLKDNMGTKTLVSSYRGEVLKLTKISRNEMGPYFCIASNGVPPSVSKRISLSIHFHPVIQVPNQLVGAPLGTDVQIECHVEASPKSINYWIKDTGEMIVSSGKYHVQEMIKSAYETKMTMIVRKFQKDDVGSYRCIAKNSLGEVDSSIRLYEIPGPNRKSSLNKHGGQGANGVGGTGGGDADANDILKMKQVKVTYQPDDEDLYGSAEDFDDSDLPPPNSYYPGERGGGGNKVPTHKPATSGGEGRHHHHHYHQVNAAGGVGGNNGLGSLFTVNGGGGGMAESAVNGGAVGDSLNGDGSGGLGVSTSGAGRVAASSFMLPLAMWRLAPNELLSPYSAAMWHWWTKPVAANAFEARKQAAEGRRGQWQWQILIVLLVTSLITSFRWNSLQYAAAVSVGGGRVGGLLVRHLVAAVQRPAMPTIRHCRQRHLNVAVAVAGVVCAGVAVMLLLLLYLRLLLLRGQGEPCTSASSLLRMLPG